MESADLNKQLASLIAAFTKLANNGGSINTPSTPASDSRLFDSISARIPKFIYEPEDERTFASWYSRYQDTIVKDGSALSSEAKTRLVLSKIDSKEYSHYSNRILPQQPHDLTYDVTITKLTETFKSTSSIFQRRQEFLRTEFTGACLEEYTGIVMRRFASSEFKKMSDDQFCCMIWINGLRDSAHGDIRTRALQIMEQKPDITLLQLEAEIKRLLDVRADAKYVAKPSSKPAEVNAVFHKQKDKKSSGPPPSACFRCGGQHWAKECPVKLVHCSKCGKDSHIEKFCRKGKNEEKKKKKVKSVVIGAATTPSGRRLYRTVTINDKKLKMQLDTGADVTLISTMDWSKIGKPPLEAPTVTIKSASHQPIVVKGSFECEFVINGHSAKGTAHVAETDTLLGIDWIAKDPNLWRLLQDTQIVNAAYSPVGSACDYLDNAREKLKLALKSEFSSVFQTGLGKCSKAKASITLRPGAQPVFRKARPVPYAALPVVSEELDRLAQSGVLKPVEHSQWAAPIVVVKKKNGKLRMCADFSTGLNDAILPDQHPLPTADDIFASLNGGKIFSQIDLAEAYLQIELDDKSKELLCINTHRGLFQFNRLPYGVKPATGIFQGVIDTMISGIDGAAAYLDDIIITGTSIEEHNDRVLAVMRRISEYGLRVRLEKCNFLMNRIIFLGFVIDENGRRPDPEKITAIQSMPAPQNVAQLRSFLGLIQFYGCFVKELFDLRPPLNELTKKDTEFIWSTKCQKSFERIKEILQSDLLLTHYDPSLPIIVAADASQYGVGTVISHRFPDGTEKAVYHGSQALTPAQRNYSQIEKEAFGLVTAVIKYHRFIHGRHFTLRTDHKPLLSIFGDKKGVPVYSANRLQRWATILLNYDFSIEYINTNDFGQADALSRLIAEQGRSKEQEDLVIAQMEIDVSASLADTCSQLPVTAAMIEKASLSDPIISKVLNYVRNGSWPSKLEKHSDLGKFSSRQNQLSIVSDCLVMGDRAVIPACLRARVLRMLHRAHPGIVRMKQLARSYAYWPSLDKDIESIVRSCDQCAMAAKDPVKNTLCSWSPSKAPWTRVHADYAGPINGTYYLVIIDSYSKWPEIVATKSTTSSATISLFRKIFAQFGFPETLVTDNGSQFTSTQFSHYCKASGINHVRSPPFHPQSNGQAERFVDTFKRALLKLQGEESADTAVQIFLQQYRATPCTSSPNHLTPAENFLSRKIRTTLDLLRPTATAPLDEKNGVMEAQFNRQHGAKQKEFQERDQVYVKDFRNLNDATWISGVVLQRLGRTLYKVQVHDLVWTRHANQLRRRDSLPQLSFGADLLDVDDAPPALDSSIPSAPPTGPATHSAPPAVVAPPQAAPPSPRRSTRIRQTPRTLNVNPSDKSYV